MARCYHAPVGVPTAVDLVCDRCGARFSERVQTLACPTCGGPLELPDVAAEDLVVDPARRGVWRYRAWLPIADERNIVTLGEGATPVVTAARWGAAIGLGRVSIKLEQIAPTGSFKDRGMTLAVSRALELGARSLVEDSSGNAGASTSAYAARAGLPATVYVPASAPPAKIRQIASTGATVVSVEGPRERVTEVALAAGRQGDAYYIGHNVNPFFSFGMTTFGFEVVEQLSDQLPDHIVMPAGGGSLYVGCWRGLRMALPAGASLPRLHLVQPTGCCPIVAAQRIGAKGAVAIERGPTIAGGAEIEHPARDRQMLAALRETNGVAVAVSDDAIRSARLGLAHREGIDVEPTAALAPAGLIELVRRGIVQPGDSVLIATTGAGLKVPQE